MPPLGLLLGKVDFANLFVTLSEGSYPSLAAAKEAGAATLNYGVFLNTVVDFVFVAFAVFLLIRQVNKLKRPAPAPGARDQGVPVLPFRDPGQGDAVPRVHVRPAGGPGLRRSQPART